MWHILYVQHRRCSSLNASSVYLKGCVLTLQMVTDTDQNIEYLLPGRDMRHSGSTLCSTPTRRGLGRGSFCAGGGRNVHESASGLFKSVRFFSFQRQQRVIKKCHEKWYARGTSHLTDAIITIGCCYPKTSITTAADAFCSVPCSTRPRLETIAGRA